MCARARKSVKTEAHLVSVKILLTFFILIHYLFLCFNNKNNKTTLKTLTNARARVPDGRVATNVKRSLAQNPTRSTDAGRRTPHTVSIPTYRLFVRSCAICAKLAEAANYLISTPSWKIFYFFCCNCLVCT